MTVVRKQIPRYVKFTKAESLAEFECPLSLSPLYCPLTVKGSKPKHTFSGPFITEISKLSKVDPLNGCALEPGWRIEDYEIDKKMASEEAIIPLTYSGILNTLSQKDILSFYLKSLSNFVVIVIVLLLLIFMMLSFAVVAFLYKFFFFL